MTEYIEREPQRFYVNTIEMTINGENRSQPKAFNTEDEAVAYYHKTMSSDMTSESVLGCIITVQNDNGLIIINDKWGTMDKPTSES